MDAKDANTSGKKGLWDRPVSIFTFISVMAVIGAVAFGLGVWVATANMTGDANWIKEFKEWRTWKAQTPDFLESLAMNLTRCVP
jgi:hypothetical protein